MSTQKFPVKRRAHMNIRFLLWDLNFLLRVVYYVVYFKLTERPKKCHEVLNYGQLNLRVDVLTRVPNSP